MSSTNLHDTFGKQAKYRPKKSHSKDFFEFTLFPIKKCARFFKIVLLEQYRSNQTSKGLHDSFFIISQK